MILVKVFVTSTDEDGREIDSDLNKIKVTVSESRTDLYDLYTNRFPLVTRLSKYTIEKYTQSIITTTHNHNNNKTETTANRNHSDLKSLLKTKRKSDLGSEELTIPKKQKLAKGNGLPQTIEKVDANEICTEKRKDSTEINGNNVVSNLTYTLNEVVWGKIRGWPHWPARITSIEGRRYQVQWFNDYRNSKLFRTQLFKFYKNYDEFSKPFAQKVGLETAAKEAVLFLAHKANDK